MGTRRFVSRTRAEAVRVADASAGTQRSSADRSVSRSAASGRYVVSQPERIAAARARVSADKKRGAVTARWIVDLAQKDG